jgi:hypothetical protein
VAVVAVAVAIASLTVRSMSMPRRGTVSFQSTQPVDAKLAAKAQDSCWFKVKNRSSRADQVRQWDAVSSYGARAERLGDLVIVTGAIQPAVHDDAFYGCSLFEYTEGSPVVMTVSTSSSPVRVESVLPFGFGEDGRKQQR